MTPNIQVSLAWEKVRVFRLSGAHLAEAEVIKKASQSTPTHISPPDIKHSLNMWWACVPGSPVGTGDMSEVIRDRTY